MEQGLYKRAEDAPASRNPHLSLEMLADIAFRHFGIEGKPRLLTSERDQNAEIICADGSGYILKVANADDDPEVIRLQNVALETAAGHPIALPLPRVVYSRAGHDLEILDFGGRTHVVRLLTRLAGIPLSRTGLSSELRADIGRIAAHIDLAFAALKSNAPRPMLWNMTNAPRARQHLPLIEDREGRRLLEAALAEAEERALPKLKTLPQQWIHSDLNLNNLLVLPEHDDRLSGVIDLGDMTQAPRIVELAVACAHQATRHEDPLAAAGEVAASYCGVIPLAPDEIALLPVLMATRLAMAILFQHAHARRSGNGHFDLGVHTSFMATIANLMAEGEKGGHRLACYVEERGRA